MFFDLASVMVVVGGTIGVTLVNYPLGDVLRLISVVRKVFFHKVTPAHEIIGQFVEFASKARREGILALESAMKEVGDPFLTKGLQLTIDGLEPANIKEILETEIDYVVERHRLGAEIFMTMGTFAPAMGMIGTLIGLVQMLKAMDDPSSIGPAMAVAIITTFYGACLANMVFLPMSGKLRKPFPGGGHGHGSGAKRHTLHSQGRQPPGDRTETAQLFAACASAVGLQIGRVNLGPPRRGTTGSTGNRGALYLSHDFAFGVFHHDEHHEQNRRDQGCGGL